VKKDEIPFPVKQKRVYIDKRKKYLNEWKQRFEAIHPGIQVYLYTDENFDSEMNKALEDVDFGCFNSDARIFVYLPEELQLSYLVGRAFNDMYSYIEVLSDPLLQENNNFPCEPDTNTWEYFYNKVYAIANKKRKEVLDPNVPNSNLIAIGTPIRLIDLKGRQACIGDTIRFANTEGQVIEHNKILWDEINLCICIGPSPFYKLMESGYIQSVTPGRGNFDFEIV
jgi:hypothetical protein